jgi:hypothetical protein
MNILSFDIGIFNLAYAALEVLSSETETIQSDKDKSLRTKIKNWGILSLKDKSPNSSSTQPKCNEVNKIGKRLFELLYEHFSTDVYDVVLIENQPCMKNPTMKSIQMMVFSYFMMRNQLEGLSMDVKFVSASNKMKVKHTCDTTHIKSSSKYTMNKKVVVAYATHYLNLTNDINEEWMDPFMKEKKRDDWADSYCQGLHYIENALK